MNKIFNKDITEIIKARHSVRTYKNEELPIDIIDKIKGYLREINGIEGPFGGKVRVELVERRNSDEEIKLGTYGVIKGANYFLAVAYKKSKYDLEDLGFLFEKVILYCTSIGLGTVWLGGTFNKGHFAKAINLQEDETLQIVSPLGFEADKKSIIAKVFGVNSYKRKDFNQLFFNEDFNTPMSYEDAGIYGEVLEMIRLAPSAMNKQPWRIVKKGNNLHIYTDGKIEMNRIDIGIALSHFYLTAKEKGLKGEFKIIDSENSSNNNYVVSWIE